MQDYVDTSVSQQNLDLQLSVSHIHLQFRPTRLFLGAFAKLRKATISFVILVCLSVVAWNNSAPTKRILIKLDIQVFFFFRKSVEAIEVSLKSENNK
jgi:hypothetical protein